MEVRGGFHSIAIITIEGTRGQHKNSLAYMKQSRYQESVKEASLQATWTSQEAHCTGSSTTK